MVAQGILKSHAFKGWEQDSSFFYYFKDTQAAPGGEEPKITSIVS